MVPYSIATKSKSCEIGRSMKLAIYVFTRVYRLWCALWLLNDSFYREALSDYLTRGGVLFIVSSHFKSEPISELLTKAVLPRFDLQLKVLCFLT